MLQNALRDSSAYIRFILCNIYIAFSESDSFIDVLDFSMQFLITGAKVFEHPYVHNRAISERFRLVMHVRVLKSLQANSKDPRAEQRVFKALCSKH